MILITGANGHLGSTVIDHLFEKNPDANIAGLVRSEEKGNDLKAKRAELKIGDYFNADAMKQAMEGVEVLAFISSGTLKGRVHQHKNVINAAKEKGVEQIFYTSVVKAEQRLSPLVFDHDETEKMIKDSGIPYTICRNTIYLEFFPMFWEDAIEAGEWTFPGNGKKQNFALRSEMGEALASALAEPGKHTNEILDFAAPTAYTFEEFTSEMSEAAGKKISYTDISVDDYLEQLKKENVPEDTINQSAVMAKLFANGGLDIRTSDMENLLGRKPADATEFVKQVVKSKLS